MTSAKHGYRLAAGGVIDRQRAVSFSYNGDHLRGYAGDTLASALIANGVGVIGRSFKYHRPRGFYGTGMEDPNSMLAVRDAYGFEPAIRAGQVRLSEGLEACSVTGWPSPEFDVAAIAQLASNVLGAGFYYKTMMWPNWRLFEPFIRRSTGFGRLDSAISRREMHHRHEVADVLVIGGGPAGLTAARQLAHSGLKIVLVDDQPRLGGALLWEAVSFDGVPASEWVDRTVDALKANANVTILTSTMATAAYEDNAFTLVEQRADEHGVRAEHHWKLRAANVVLATGMVDRPLLFADNDRPGIMLGSSVRRLIGEFGVAPADRLTVYTNNDSGYLTAIAARKAGIDVPVLVDTRPQGQAIHAAAAEQSGVRCVFDSQIEGTSGYKHLKAVTVRGSSTVESIRCSGLAVSGGWTPLIQLAGHRGVKPVYQERESMFVVRAAPPGWHVIGGAAGSLHLTTTLAQARAAASAIGSDRGVPVEQGADVSVDCMSYGSISPQWIPDCGARSRMWVDFQNDVKVSDLDLAARENYVSVEHLKRYTTLGMGTDQGRTSNINGLAVMAGLTDRAINAVGTTTFRPPYSAVRMGTIANRRDGDLHQPRRYLPAHAIHEKLGGVIEDFGWERPDWYRSNGADRESAVEAEMVAVRNHVGVFDGSSLGKIEVTGPDAGLFLSRFYVSNMATLKPGGVRYSVMLKEDGVIFDDGVVACLGPNHFLAGPTSGNAEAVAGWFEQWRQTEWPTMRVAVAPVTANWASIAIAGPCARDLLARLEPDFDISSEVFKHMQVREGHVAGVPARVARVSFTGELQYEVSVPSRYAASLLNTLLERGSGLTPRAVGMEAWLRLRLEKGYIHLGSDTNGRTTPLDIGMGGIVAKRKDDFLGKRSLSLAFATSEEREQLVGVEAIDGTLQAGGRILASGHERTPCPSEGYITSACFSPSLGKSIGLALVVRGNERKGETVSVFSDGSIIRCRLTSPTFYDAENKRLNT